MSDCAGKRRAEGLSPDLDALSPKLPGLSPNLTLLSHNLNGFPGQITARIIAPGRGLNTLVRTVRDGRLALKYPEQPNHPQQAYRAAGNDQ